jgi:hypothetical protein
MSPVWACKLFMPSANALRTTTHNHDHDDDHDHNEVRVQVRVFWVRGWVC